MKERDASHDLSDTVYLRLLLKAIAPGACELRRFVLSAITTATEHWRSRSITTKQRAEALKAIVLAGRGKQVRRILVGGDDGVVATIGPIDLRFTAVESLRVRMTMNIALHGIFSLHSMLHSAKGSFADVYKMAVKILDRRFPARKEDALLRIRDYQIAFADA
jgi:hypothetical protein